MTLAGATQQLYRLSWRIPFFGKLASSSTPGYAAFILHHQDSAIAPFGGASATRLYLAESIAAVVEVKSNVSAQWQQAQRTAAQLAPLRRKIGAEMVMGGFAPGERIPLFVTGYTGWKNVESVKEALEQAPDIAGILVVDSGIFVSSAAYGSMTATGPWALWGLISILHLVTNALQAASTNPFAYAQ